MAEELDLGAMMNKIMSDPNFAELMKNIKSSASTGGVEEAAVEKKETANESRSDTEEMTDVEKGNGQNQSAAAATDKLSELVETLAPLIKNTSTHAGESEKRNRLLAALKPYVNENRREMIDTVMSLSKITNIIDIMPKGKL